MPERARTKIICTLGPASSSRSVLRQMMLAGMDVVRLNFSHGSNKDRLEQIRIIRELNVKYRRSVKILGDLEGFRIRIGRLKGPVQLKPKQIVWLTQQETAGKDGILPFDYSGDLSAIKEGQLVFIDDGLICLEVIGRKPTALQTKVVIAGLVKERKGINLPQAKLKFSGLTDQDLADIDFCREQRVDLLAQSFVRSAADITAIRRLLKNQEIRLIAKIENREGIRNIEQIIEASDGIMIARGDMGVSLPIYEVPIVQKRIIKKCRKRGKLAITATQMLESMTDNLRPTRAEVSDVANAVLDGTTYTMLSGETAVGQYPVETVKMMDRIIKFTEASR